MPPLSALLLILAIAAEGADFADLGLSNDAEAIIAAHFPDQPESELCVRGEPQRWLPSSTWKKAGPFAAIETMLLRGGGSITIIDWGCESYVASIRYVFPPGGRQKRAADALRILRRAGANPVFDLGRAEAALRRNEELVAGDGEDFLQTRIVLMREGTIAGSNAGFVEFRLVKGPL